MSAQGWDFKVEDKVRHCGSRLSKDRLSCANLCIRRREAANLIPFCSKNARFFFFPLKPLLRNKNSSDSVWLQTSSLHFVAGSFKRTPLQHQVESGRRCCSSSCCCFMSQFTSVAVSVRRLSSLPLCLSLVPGVGSAPFKSRLNSHEATSSHCVMSRCSRTHWSGSKHTRRLRKTHNSISGALWSPLSFCLQFRGSEFTGTKSSTNTLRVR